MPDQSTLISTPRILGVDTGGTFTDFVYYQQGLLKIHKVLSTPQAPEQAILQGITEMGLDNELDGLSIVHGSTVATNAVLEKKGVKTVYITNKGLADVLTIGRQARRELYNLTPEQVIPPVPKELCFEVNSRVDAQGQILQALDNRDLQRLKGFIQQAQPRAVAINLLFSFLNDQDERRIEVYLKAQFPNLFISRSSDVLPEYKEYERGIACWLNAWVGPLVQGYLRRLESRTHPAALTVMQSSGGTIAASKAADHAVRMLLSGPAGGLAGAKFIAQTFSGTEQKTEGLLTFDMGGTSTDVALIEGDLQLTSEGHIGEYPVAVSMVDMHTIGAGGGSIARVDDGGILQVGPQSAGATPGPACYAKGGNQATVTDANLVLGRLSAEDFLGGSMSLDEVASRTVVAQLTQKLGWTEDHALEQTALGILQVANEHMSRALRVMSIQRGVDPKTLTLVPFGGAGALHVCALAENLQMTQALVPVYAGVLSAFGMVAAPRSRELSHTINAILDESQVQEINQQLQHLEQKGRNELISEGVEADQISVQPSVDLRYLGQSYTLNIQWQDLRQALEDFHQLHQKRYGHQHQQAIELVNVRIKASAVPVQVQLPELESAVKQPEPIAERQMYAIKQQVSVYQRETLLAGQMVSGPALIVEQVSTTWLAPHWFCTVDRLGNLQLSRQQPGGQA